MNGDRDIHSDIDATTGSPSAPNTSSPRSSSPRVSGLPGARPAESTPSGSKRQQDNQAEKTGMSGGHSDPGSINSKASRNKRRKRRSSARKNRRYQTTGQLGQGGWGVVERAIDRQLKRPVAIKRIAADGNIPHSLKQRFLHEARVTSQLQHPGIVPVHELEDGDAGSDTFYVMKLLSGDTFREAIRTAHKQHAESGKSGTYALRATLLPLLERFIDICDAVAYAHEQGVIHRDLKPDNVMVGEFGETMVVDWGLAKRIREDAEAAEEEATINHRLNEVESLVQAAASPTGRTMAGSVIGTPAYMPPEQAEGKVDTLSPASDIFSLGATLYEIVVGKHPHSNAKSGTVLERVKNGERTPARSVRPEVPKELCAICEKAMALEPADRYRTATDLAGDVRRFVAGDAVSVVDENLIEKAARWCRRNRIIAFSAAGATFVALVVSLIAAVLINSAHRAELEAHQQTQRAYSEAMDRLEQSRLAADQWLIELSGSLQFYPGLNPVRQELIQQATVHYEDLLRCELTTTSAQPESSHGNLLEQNLKLERAKVLLRLGDLLRLGGDCPRAVKRYNEAEAILTELEDADSVDASSAEELNVVDEAMLQLANVEVGLLLAQTGSANAFDHADVDNWKGWLDEMLAGVAPESRQATEADEFDSLTFELASCRSRLSIACSRVLRANSKEEASRAAREAIVWARWLKECRGSTRDVSLYETALTNAADSFEAISDFDSSSQFRAEQIAHLEEATADSPLRIDRLQSLAYARLRLANALANCSDSQSSDRARLQYELSISDFRSAWRLSDSDGFYQDNLASAENNLGMLIASQTGATDLASRHLQNSIDIRKSLIRQQQNVHDIRQYCHTVAALADLREGDERMSLLNDADTAFQLVRDHDGLSTKDRLTWISVLQQRSRLHEASGNSEAAAVDKAIAERLQAGN